MASISDSLQRARGIAPATAAALEPHGDGVDAPTLVARGKCVDIAAVARQSRGELHCEAARESLEILPARAEERKRIVEARIEKHVENGPQQFRAYRIPESTPGIGPS
ncbi:MAG: hypothetical protein OXI87_01345 [Albidovulum sp.]|nr:hypothetical protein [Albidovulum sp.]